MKVLSLLLATVVFGSIAVAQERSIDKAAFESMVEAGNASVKWSGQKYRMTVNTRSKIDGRPQTDWSSNMIIEYGPKGEVKSVSNSSFGGTTRPTTRSLRLGDTVYTRTGDQAWMRTEKQVNTPREPNESTTRETTESDIKYRYLGPAVYRNNTSQTYAKTSHRSSVDQTSGAKTESDITTTYWVDANGIILKTEFRAEGQGTNSTHHTMIVTEWELDPSIEFTPPEIGT